MQENLIVKVEKSVEKLASSASWPKVIVLFVAFFIIYFTVFMLENPSESAYNLLAGTEARVESTIITFLMFPLIIVGIWAAIKLFLGKETDKLKLSYMITGLYVTWAGLRLITRLIMGITTPTIITVETLFILVLFIISVKAVAKIRYPSSASIVIFGVLFGILSANAILTFIINTLYAVQINAAFSKTSNDPQFFLRESIGKNGEPIYNYSYEWKNSNKTRFCELVLPKGWYPAENTTSSEIIDIAKEYYIPKLKHGNIFCRNDTLGKACIMFEHGGPTIMLFTNSIGKKEIATKKDMPPDVTENDIQRIEYKNNDVLDIIRKKNDTGFKFQHELLLESKSTLGFGGVYITASESDKDLEFILTNLHCEMTG